MVKLIVYGEPIGKGRPRFTKMGHAFTPERTRQFEAKIRGAYNERGLPMMPDVPLRFDLEAFMPIPKTATKKMRMYIEQGIEYPTKKPDCSNILKACEDALNGVAYSDDRFIVKESVNKYYSDRPRVEITISEV